MKNNDDKNNINLDIEYKKLLDYSKDLLNAGLYHPQKEIRFYTAELLADIKDDRGKDYLLNELNNNDENIRIRAINSLDKLDDKNIVSKLEERYKIENNLVIKALILKVLCKYKKEKVLNEIIKILTLNNEDAHKICLSFLINIPSQYVFPILEEIIYPKDKNFEHISIKNKIDIASYLAKNNNIKGLNFLKDMLKNKDKIIALLSARELSKLGIKEIIPFIKERLEKGDWYEKIIAIQSFLNLGIKEDLVKKIYKPLDKGLDNFTKIEIIKILHNFYPENTYNLLYNMFHENEDKEIKIKIIETIGELKDKNLLPIVNKVLLVGPEYLRVFVINSIEKIKDKKTLFYLVPILEKSHWQTRLLAAKTIIKVIENKY